MILTHADKLLLSGLLPGRADSLRAVLCEAAPDWNVIINRADLHGLVALLRFNLAQAGLLTTLPSDVQAALSHLTQFQTARHLACVSEARRLMRAMKAVGVTTIPLKGAALMLGDYYPQPGLRFASDLDLLVRPDELAEAERVAHECGYVVKKYPDAEPGTTLLPPRAEHRLPSELNHAEARTGPGGLLLELHRRAFHYARGARDFGFAEMTGRAAPHPAEPDCLLPAPEDLALHLVHHTLVDLRSTHLILRTMADLHFITQRDPDAPSQLTELAARIGFGEAAQAALELLRLLREGSDDEIVQAAQGGPLAALLEAALQPSPALAVSASLFEHFDVRQSVAGAVKSLAAVVLSSPDHLARDYGAPGAGRNYWHYVRRVRDVLQKFSWRSLHPSTLRRMIRLRRIGRPSAGR